MKKKAFVIIAFLLCPVAFSQASRALKCETQDLRISIQSTTDSIYVEVINKTQFFIGILDTMQVNNFLVTNQIFQNVRLGVRDYIGGNVRLANELLPIIMLRPDQRITFSLIRDKEKMCCSLFIDYFVRKKKWKNNISYFKYKKKMKFLDVDLK